MRKFADSGATITLLIARPATRVSFSTGDARGFSNNFSVESGDYYSAVQNSGIIFSFQFLFFYSISISCLLCYCFSFSNYFPFLFISSIVSLFKFFFYFISSIPFISLFYSFSYSFQFLFLFLHLSFYFTSSFLRQTQCINIGAKINEKNNIAKREEMVPDFRTPL